MKKENLKVQVDIEPKGLGKLRADWMGMAGDLAEPMLLLAAGATKAEAAWGGFKGIIEGRVLGPIGLLAGAATGFLLTTKSLISHWREMGMSGAASLESMQLRFKPLLGSVEEAKMRVKELVDFTAKTPFRLGESAEANQLLETLTKGALSTKEGMTLVGDSAAVAGESFASTARQIGRLYDGLDSGRPVGEASMRLQELGLVSGETRNKIEEMQKANVAGSAIWKIVESDLKRNVGAMDDLSTSIEGLDSTIEDLKEGMQAGFSSGFLEGEKAGMESTIKVMEKMSPVANYLGEIIGSVSNMWEVFKGKVVGLLASFPGLTSIIKLVAVGLVGLAATISLTAGALGGRFLISVLSVKKANEALVKSLGDVTKATAAQTGVVKLLGAAKFYLSNALKAVKAGNYATAVSHLRAGAAAAGAALKTNFYATAVIVLRGALGLLKVGLKFVTVQLYAMAVAIASNPIFWIVGGIVALVGVLLHFNNVAKKSKEALDAYKKSADNLSDTLDRQRRSIKNLSDLRKQEAQVIRNLIKAHQEEDDFRRKGQKDMLEASQKKIAALETQRAKLKEIATATLEMSDTERKRAKFLEKGKEKAAKLRREFEARTPEQQLDLAKTELNERLEKKQTEEDSIAAEALTKKKIRQNSSKAEDLQVEVAKQELEVTREESKYNQSKNGEGGLFGNSDEYIAKYKKNLDDARGKLQLLQEQQIALGTGLKEKLASGSERDRLEGKIELSSSLKSATDEFDAAEDGVASAKDKDAATRKKAQARLGKAEIAKNALNSLDKKYGFDSNPLELQKAQDRIQEIDKERDENLDPEKLEAAKIKAEQKDRELQNANDRSRLNTEGIIASIKAKGLEKEQESLEMARKKVDLAVKQEAISEKDAENQLKVIQAQQVALDKKTADKIKEVKGDFSVRRLERERKGALRSGDQDKAKSLRKEIDSKLDEKSERNFRKKAEGLFTDKKDQDAFVDSRLKENKSARDQNRSFEEEDRERARKQSSLDVVKDEVALNASVLRSAGKSKEAQALEEATAKKQDALDRESLKKGFVDQGFSEEKAESLADRQVKTNQAGRLLDKLSSQGSGSTTADSLASVGGGGNAAGVDPNTKILEDIKSLVKAINPEGGDIVIK